MASGSFAALEHKNFRLLWLGQLVSMTGSMMQSAAVLWHVSTLVPEERRAAALGVVGLVKFVPIVCCSLLAGVAADALDRRKLMLWTQSAMALLAMLLAWLTFRGEASLWTVYTLTALSSAAASFDGPARQSLVPELVPARHFANAISLNTLMFQLAATAGPALSGIVIGALEIGWVYALNAASFLAVIVGLVCMDPLPPRDATRRSDFTWKAALEGLTFVFKAPLIRSSMLLDFFATFFASAMALLPIFAVDILHVGAQGYGLLAAAPAIGAAAASVVLVKSSERIVRRGAWLLWAVAAYGLATVAFGFSTHYWLTFACLACTGIADTVSMVLRNIVRQLTTPDELRGRMTGVNMVFFMGGPQLGELEAGLVAQAVSPAFSVVSGGLACIAATTWIAWSTPELRRYRKSE